MSAARRRKQQPRARRNDELAPVEHGAELVPQIAGARADLNPAWVYIRSLAVGSAQATMISVCKTIAALHRRTIDTMPWAELRYQHVQLIRQMVAPPKYAVRTANKLMSGLRGVLRESMNLGFIGGDDYLRASRVKGFRGSSLPAGRALTEEEISKLFITTAQEPKEGDDRRVAYKMAMRDRAMLALLYGAGLRRDEVVKVDVDSFSRVDGVRVHGKGKKERLVPLGPWALEALELWLDVRGHSPGPLLSFVGRYGKIQPGHRLTSQVIADRLVALAAAAGIKRLGPHDMRRTFITLLLDEGADAPSVQRLAGHERIDTTMGYDRRGEKAKKAAAAKLPEPRMK